MAIKLFDSLSRELRELRPSHPDGVFRFYTCGPTVYAPAHIGNFRTFVVNDVLRRLLDLEFPGKVRHVRNLTDVDDRTIGQARLEKRPLSDITRKWTELFHADCAALNCLRPHVEPSATGHIREQVDMIEVLMRKGNAYRAGITKRVYPHLFRHSFATEALRRGMNPIQLAKILGHTSLRMIERTYSHLDQTDAYDAVLKMLASAGGR